ncbi:MAG: Nramp family divalent metal transporter, partial [Chitinophagaceae bacterium]
MGNNSISKPAWRKENISNSLPEVFSTINVPMNGGFWKKLLAFSGPGLMVAVGYMDPGNWATDIAGGSQFGYTLLSVILISNFFAIVLQHLAVKLGVVAERDLAQACRDHFSPSVSFVLWILCEIAIAACDLAEVIGSAIALNILFGIPLAWGVVLTGLDVLVILFFQYKGFRLIESIVAGLTAVIFICFIYDVIKSQPELFPMLSGLIPRSEVVTNPAMLYIAIGILGATVMPHNLYLHSSIVQTRNYPRDTAGKKMAVKFATIDSSMSLLLAFFVNAAILVLAAATFHTSGHKEVADIMDAHKLLAPLLGTTLASTFFAIALLASGQNST